MKHLHATITAVRAMGKRVVLVAPPPVSGFDVGRCLELRANRKTVFGADSPSCAISEAQSRKHRVGVRSLLERISREADVAIIHLDDFLCHAGTCAVELDNIFLYRDGGHFSHEGSRQLGIQLGLADKLWAAAR